MAVGADQLATLVIPSLRNGAPPERIKQAVGAIVRAGERLAPWTLQEHLAKQASTAVLGFVQ